jgi:serine/threonine-protein kinase
MKDFTEQSKEFRELGVRINAFLGSEVCDLTEAEAEASSPILQSLDESRYHFTDEQFLIAGGEKKIFKVYDSHASRYVAIASPRKHETELEKEQFLREAQLTAKLQHPNILPIYEVGLNSEGIPYFVMRLLQGEELKTIVRERTASHTAYHDEYDMDTLLEIFLKVCDAVIYAHSRGVLHLDLKPSNIMVGRYGQVTLFDWGLAKVVGDEADITLDETTDNFDPDLLNNITYSGTMKGTPGYMAPEQITDSGNVTGRTDVYALGAVLYFILTGTIPVKGSHAEEVILNTLDGHVIRPRIRFPSRNLPGSLGAVAMKALQLAPGNRYESVQELHDDVTRYLRGYAPRAEKAGPVKRMQLFVRRHSHIVSAVMLFGLILTSVITLSLFKVSAQREQAEAAKKEAVFNLELYKEEALVSAQLYGDVKTFLINSIYRGEVWDYGLMRKILSQEMEKNGNDEKYAQQLHLLDGYLHFINEEFVAARAALDRAGHDPKNNLYKRCAHYAETKPDDSELLDWEELTELLSMPYRNTYFRKNLLSRCYERHMARVSSSVDPEAYLPAAIAMLNLLNDSIGWGGHVRLEPREGGYHLDLSDAPYSTMRLAGARWGKGAEVLLPLNLVSLDLSDSSVRDFHGLQLPDTFEELILLDVDIYDPQPTVFWLGRIPMERLIIRKGMLPAYYRTRLQEDIDVVELPPGKNRP